MTLDFFSKLRDNTEKLPDHVAFQFIGSQGRETFTYQRISREILAIGGYLRSKGIQKGDTVGILMENHPRWGIAFLAAQSVGARIVPFDVLHTAETLAHLVQHSDSCFLISSSAVEDKLREVQALLPEKLPVLMKGYECTDGANWDQVLEAGAPDSTFPLVETDLDETSLIVYTSGTTGNPKGVMLSPRNLYQTVVSVLEAIEIRPEDHFLSVLPLYHMLALMCNFIAPLYVGATVTYLEALEPQKVVRAFREEGITIFVCVPQFFYVIYRKILQNVEKQAFIKRFLFKRLLRLSHFSNHRLGVNLARTLFPQIHRTFGTVRLFGVGGARFDRKVLESMYNMGFNIIQAYGMTETSAISTLAPLGVEGLGSVGQSLPHGEVSIDDPDDEGIGEVLIRGQHIMQGYWKNPDATRETFKDGWLRSGDLGYISRQGLLHITGRTKDVIVLSSGKNIFPEEIENAYECDCPFIKEMCVLGIEDTTSSEQQEKLHAVIVPDFDYMKSQKVVNAGDMIRYMMETISQKLPPHKRVRSFEIRRDPLPRTPTRKIKRFEVQQQLSQAPPGESRPQFAEESQPKSAAEEKVFTMIRKAARLEVVNREMSLELDCGFDSLERVEFLSNVQDIFGVQVSDDEAIEVHTVQDLIELVERLTGGRELNGDQQERTWAEILAAPLRSEEKQQIQKILKRRPIVELIYYLLTRIILLLSKVLFRQKRLGLENLPDRAPFMICPNHLSFVDGFLLAGALPLRVIRKLFFLGYSDYFGTGLMSFLGSLIKVVPVDPDRNLRQALRLGAQGLEDQLILAIFPEGERSIDGELKPFRKGPAILATERKIPVVPAAFEGTYEVWRRGSGRIRLHPVTITFGEPMNPAPGETAEEFNERLRQAVSRLLHDGSS